MKAIMRLLCVVLALAWPSLALAQNGVPYSANVQMPAFVSASSGAGALADGTSGAPSIAFASEPTLGCYRSAAGTITCTGGLALSASNSFSAGGDITLGAANMVRFGARLKFRSPADGIYTALNSAETIGAEFKVDALPVASSCGAGSPAVVAGSTPMSGSVTVGTGGPLTCTITFGGTAYPSAPHCNGAVETTTAANARAMGYSASATVLTIVPSAAWADSSVVNWDCFSSK